MPSGLATDTAAGRAAIAAVETERSIGRPVFLRYVDDAPSADSILPSLAGGIALACRCLGPAQRLYATAQKAENGSLTYLTATLMCTDGAVAQIGVGLAPGRRAAPGLLLIGDQGTLESNPAASGFIYESEQPSVPLRDDHAAARLETGNAHPAALTGEPISAVVAAVHRSLASGLAEPVEGTA